MKGMPIAGLALLLGVAAAALAVPPAANDPPPSWAFWEERPLEQPLPEAGLTVPGSALTITREVHDDADAAPDWSPSEHPAMPAVVGRGRAPGKYAFNLRHLPNGVGYPDCADLAGLPAA